MRSSINLKYECELKCKIMWHVCIEAGVRAEVESEIARICATNIARFKSRTVNRSSLSELFVSFLAKVIF